MAQKILIIEDEPLVRENILDLLQAENFEAIGAENGRIGIKMAQQHLPDLIICDVMMPEVNGYEVLQTLQQDETTATLPFIFLSAKSDRIDLRQGMVKGANDYLTKPCTPAELMEAITTQLKKQTLARSQTQQQLDNLRHSISLSLPHELLTPLNAVLGFAELLIDDPAALPAEEVAVIAKDIYDAGERLRHLVENFILYARLELIAADSAQRQMLLQSYLETADVLIMEVALLQAQQASRVSDLHLDVAEATLQISEAGLQKAVAEVVNNAFKFSQPGTPVKLQGQVEGDRYRLSVSDHGRGMNAAQIASVGAYLQFERQFYEQQGSGLGLSLARHLAELHGGELTIESIPDQQTMVHLSLKLK